MNSVEPQMTDFSTEIALELVSYLSLLVIHLVTDRMKFNQLT
jgi:hypothetical protein